MRLQLVGRLERKGLGWLAEETASNVIADFSASILQAPEGEEGARLALPFDVAEVSGPVPPSAEVIASFRSAIWRLLHLRSTDQLRRYYVREKVQKRLSEGFEQAQPEPDLDALRFVAAVAARIDRLPDEDRLLLLDSSDRADGPRTNVERQKIFRLRRRLFREAFEELGAGREPDKGM